MSQRLHSRARDRIRDLVRRSKKPTHPPTAPQAGAQLPLQANSAVPLHAHASNQSGRAFFDKVLLALTEQDRETIEGLGLSSASQDIDIVTVLDHAYRAAVSQKQLCEDKRWRWDFRGRTILLRDEADKVLAWLDRFKSVGDVVSNADPVHIGLPWAGVRVILEMAVSESRQMAALVIGMNLALCMANRLNVYMNYFQRLPPTLAATNLENALIMMYAHELRFLAIALETYKKSGTIRLWDALSQNRKLQELENFGKRCDDLDLRAEAAANSCHRELDEQRWEGTEQLKEDLKQALRRLDDIQSLRSALDHLQVKIDLTKLKIAEGAVYNSYAEGHYARCLNGTRTQLLSQVADWADDPNGKCIFWLCGMAGTGKSTISRTVAHTLDQHQRLGASFFFKRGEGERRNARLFFPTIAYQLAAVVPGLGGLIAKALVTDSYLHDKELREQFEKLLSRPLLDLAQGSTSSRVIIVIDALDECEQREDIETVLTLLARLESIDSPRLRVFVTSRPELPIQRGFMSTSGILHQDTRLEEVQATTIEQDIRTYLQHRLKEIREENLLLRKHDPLPADWPGQQDLQALVDLTVPLFIAAFTVCRFIAGSRPHERLQTILQQRGQIPLTGLHEIYLPILDQLVLRQDKWMRGQAVIEFKELVGPIILLADPLSVSALSSLLAIPPGDVEERLRNLHSVLYIPDGRDTPVRLLHLSFRDALVDKRLKEENKFWIDEVRTHNQIAAHCLRLLSKSERFQQDICAIKHPGARRGDTKQQVHSAIATEVAYACSYWVGHVVQSKEKLRDDGHVHEFLLEHFLHWLEALSWLGRLSQAASYLSGLRSLIDVERGARLLAFLNDASRFVLRCRHIIDLAPLQAYSSALVFAPRRSIVRQQFQRYIPKWMDMLPGVISNWTLEIQKLEGHNEYVSAVAFSPNGLVIATASFDKTVQLWKVDTGEHMWKLEGHDGWVTDVTFSPDGRFVASSSYDRSIRIWNAATGDGTREIRGHDSTVTAVAFSPDGQALVSASMDGTIRLWNAATGNETQKLGGLYYGFTSIRFSPDGRVLASASYDKILRLWNVGTGEEIKNLRGHDNSIMAIAFSLDGHFIASGSKDQTVRLWDIEAGQETQELTGHDEPVTAVAFSPDGHTAASASFDRTVRLWNTGTGKEMQKLEGHDLAVTAVKFSPDGQVVASASFDKTVRLWNAATEEETQKREGHDDRVTAVAFSPNGQSVASASFDRTIRLWDAATGKETRKLEGHDKKVVHVVFSPDGLLVASVSDDTTVRLWNTITGEEAQKLGGHDRQITAVAFSLDGQALASASYDKILRLWNVGTGEEIKNLRGHDNSIMAIAFSPDGRFIASGSTDQTVRLWDVERGQETQKLEHDGCVWSVAFSPDGNMIASGSSDNTVRLWKVNTGENTQRLTGHDGWVMAVVFSPHGEVVTSASYDHTVRLWDASSGEEIHLLRTDRAIKELAFAHGGRMLYTNAGSFDVSLHTMSSPKVVSIAGRLTLSDQWIRQGDQDLLWLPHEFRGSESSVSNNTLVIGQADGTVSFFGFNTV